MKEKHNLRLVNDKPGWNPIVLQKAVSDLPERSQLTSKLLGLRLAGWYPALGLFSILPFWWVDLYRHKQNRWFDK